MVSIDGVTAVLSVKLQCCLRSKLLPATAARNDAEVLRVDVLLEHLFALQNVRAVRTYEHLASV